jgi:hypothetical protein
LVKLHFSILAPDFYLLSHLKQHLGVIVNPRVHWSNLAGRFHTMKR